MLSLPFLKQIKFILVFCLINVLTMPNDDFLDEFWLKKNKTANKATNARGIRAKIELKEENFDEQFGGRIPGKAPKVGSQVKKEEAHRQNGEKGEPQNYRIFEVRPHFGRVKMENKQQITDGEQKPILVKNEAEKISPSSSRSSEFDTTQKRTEKGPSAEMTKLGHKRQRLDVSAEASKFKRLRIGEDERQQEKMMIMMCQSESSENNSYGESAADDAYSSYSDEAADDDSSYKAEESQDSETLYHEARENLDEYDQEMNEESDHSAEWQDWDECVDYESNDESPKSAEGQEDTADFEYDASADSSAEALESEALKELKKGKNLKNYLSDEQRMEIVRNFMEMKNQFYERGEKRPSCEINKEIAAELGVNERTIYKWKNKFGFGLKRQKKEILKSISQLKSRNPQMTLAQIQKELPFAQFYKKEIHETFKKLKIIDKFDKIKAKKAHPLSLREKRKIAEQFGVKIRTIYQWKNNFGLKEEQGYTKKEKLKLLKRYQQMEKENPQMTMAQILKELKMNQSTFLLWRRQFKIKIKKHFLSDDEKLKIIQKFNKMKKEEKQPIRREDKERIAKHLGFSLNAILRWKNEFGDGESRNFKLEEKIKLLKKYYKIKEKCPKISDKKIAKALNICTESIRKWKKAHGDKIEKKDSPNGGDEPKSKGKESISRHYPADAKCWKWNFSTEKRIKKNRNAYQR